MQKKPELWRLFIIFFRLGLFTFGGGFAMIPLIEEEMVKRYALMKKGEFFDLVAVTQSLPGAMAVNVALFVGNHLRGIPGALISALAVIIPSFLVIIIIASLLVSLMDHQLVINAFRGLRPAVLVLIIVSLQCLSEEVSWTVGKMILVAIIIAAISLFSLNPVVVVIVSALLGYFVFYQPEDRGCEGGREDADH